MFSLILNSSLDLMRSREEVSGILTSLFRHCEPSMIRGCGRARVPSPFPFQSIGSVKSEVIGGNDGTREDTAFADIGFSVVCVTTECIGHVNRS